MSNKPEDKSETNIASEPNALPKKKDEKRVELTDEELKKVSGGVTNYPSQSATADANAGAGHTGWIEISSLTHPADKP